MDIFKNIKDPYLLPGPLGAGIRLLESLDSGYVSHRIDFMNKRHDLMQKISELLLEELPEYTAMLNKEVEIDWKQIDPNDFIKPPMLNYVFTFAKISYNESKKTVEAHIEYTNKQGNTGYTRMPLQAVRIKKHEFTFFEWLNIYEKEQQ